MSAADQTTRRVAASPGAAARVALVTGAGRGIGAATARLLAARGWAVCVNYARDAASAQALVDSIGRDGAHAIAVHADVSIEADVLRLYAAVDAGFGRLDALVNNAGVVAPGARVETFDAQRLQRMFAINVIGSFLCAREAIRRMSTRHGGAGGAIVNVSSAAARLGSPGEYVDYAASKGAIDTMTIGLSKELGSDGIRVNAVRPGIITTDIHASGGDAGRVERILGAGAVPMQRAGTADEVAAVIAWLLSNEASYVTGAIVDASGGR